MDTPQHTTGLADHEIDLNAPLHVAVAPGLLQQQHIVIRADDDTDEDYEEKQQLLDAILSFARKA